jgi:hypothetical protein
MHDLQLRSRWESEALIAFTSSTLLSSSDKVGSAIDSLFSLISAERVSFREIQLRYQRTVWPLVEALLKQTGIDTEYWQLIGFLDGVSREELRQNCKVLKDVRKIWSCFSEYDRVMLRSEYENFADVLVTTDLRNDPGGRMRLKYLQDLYEVTAIQGLYVFIDQLRLTLPTWLVSNTKQGTIGSIKTTSVHDLTSKRL